MMDNSVLYDVAKKYYLENKTQQEIANEYGIVRVQISKYLKLAREKGIVTISLSMPSVSRSKAKALERFFMRNALLEQLLLVDVVEKRPEHFLPHLVSEAWRLLPSLITQRQCSIGLGWGESILQLSQNALLHPMKRPQWSIYPMSGGISRIDDRRFNINVIIDNFAKACEAVSHPIYLPFYLDNQSSIRALSSEVVHEEFTRAWDTLDALIFGVGSNAFSKSPAFREQLMSGLSLNKIIAAEAVGDVLTHFLNRAGDVIELDNAQQFVNISMKQFLRVKQRIAIAGGAQKVEAIAAALKAKLITTLIIDTTTACAIMDFLKEEDTYAH